MKFFYTLFFITFFHFSIGNQGECFASSSELNAVNAWSSFRIVASANGKTGTTLILFGADMTKGLDVAYDAGLMRSGSSLPVFTRLVWDNGVEFAIQTLPLDIYEELVIPLGIDLPAGGLVTISAQIIDLPAECNVTVEDRQTGVFKVLKNVGSSYQVVVAPSQPSTGRFFIHTSVISGNQTEAVNVWTAKVSLDWNNAQNWSFGALPSDTTNVFIPDTVRAPRIYPSTTASCRNLTISAADTVVIESDSNKCGSLIVSHFCSGKVKFNRSLLANRWYLYNSPAVGGALSQFLQQNATIPTNTQGKRGAMFYNSQTSQWNPFLENNAMGNLAFGNALCLRSAADSFITSVGNLELLENTVSANVGADRWLLLGNPFTSAIAINDNLATMANFLTENVINQQNIDPNYAAIYVWDESATNSSYRVINNSSDPYFASVGQGFFVKLKDGISTVNIPKSLRAHQSNATFKSSKIDFKTIKIEASQNNQIASTAIKFRDDMTIGFDVLYDAGGMFLAEQFSVYSRLQSMDGVGLAIQCLPIHNEQKMVIPVCVESKSDGELVLKIDANQMLDHAIIVLEDRLMNQFYNITPKNLVVTSHFATDELNVNRFFLHLAPIANVAATVAFKSPITVSVANNMLVVRGCFDSSYSVKIVGLEGKVVAKFDCRLGDCSNFVLPEVAKGVYVVLLQRGSEVFASKIVM